MKRVTIYGAVLLVMAMLVYLCGCGAFGDNPSARCVDGTMSHSQNCSGTCSGHGGVAEWFNNCGNGGSGQDLPPPPPR